MKNRIYRWVVYLVAILSFAMTLTLPDDPFVKARWLSVQALAFVFVALLSSQSRVARWVSIMVALVLAAGLFTAFPDFLNLALFFSVIGWVVVIALTFIDQARKPKQKRSKTSPSPEPSLSEAPDPPTQS
ncbi:hypothetical protein KW800_02440 [Candidatus Parcubacteria bacterium]|nr:hypothetical protein [Candidatus Parcubacteria bacterium]